LKKCCLWNIEHKNPRPEQTDRGFFYVTAPDLEVMGFSRKRFCKPEQLPENSIMTGEIRVEG